MKKKNSHKGTEAPRNKEGKIFFVIKRLVYLCVFVSWWLKEKKEKNA
jgi:hypothetical protein